MTGFISGMAAPGPLRELESHQVGRHTYTVLSEIPPDPAGEAFRVRYVYRVTEGSKVISEEELTGSFYHPAWDVLQRELTGAGFTQAQEAGSLLAWRLA